MAAGKRFVCSPPDSNTDTGMVVCLTGDAPIGFWAVMSFVLSSKCLVSTVSLGVTSFMSFFLIISVC